MQNVSDSDDDSGVENIMMPEACADERTTLMARYFSEDQLKLFVGSNFDRVISEYLFETEEERALCFRIFWHKYFFAYDKTFGSIEKPKELSLEKEENSAILQDVNPLNILIKRFEHPSMASRILERCTKDLSDPSSVKVPWQSSDMPNASYYVENGRLKLNEEVVYLSSLRQLSSIVLENTHPFQERDL